MNDYQLLARVFGPPTVDGNECGGYTYTYHSDGDTPNLTHCTPTREVAADLFAQRIEHQLTSSGVFRRVTD